MVYGLTEAVSRSEVCIARIATVNEQQHAGDWDAGESTYLPLLDVHHADPNALLFVGALRFYQTDNVQGQVSAELVDSWEHADPNSNCEVGIRQQDDRYLHQMHGLMN